MDGSTAGDEEFKAAHGDHRAQVVVTINGPGEISGWLVPFAHALKAGHPGVRICVALLPCAFAARSELSLLMSFPFVDAACSVRQSLALIFGGRVPVGFDQSDSSIVLHMGGDPTWTWLLAKRLKQPCFAYVENSFLLQNRFQRVFFAGLQLIPESRRPANSMVVGDLVVDAAWLTCPDRQPAPRSAPVVGLYPGSRDYLVTYTLPFLAEVVDLVSQRMSLRWQLAKADFLSSAFLRNIPDVNDGRSIAGQNLRWSDGGDGDGVLMTKLGNRIEIVSHQNASSLATLAITIPGTATAELAALGIPMIVILPLMESDKVPIPGPMNYADRIPLIGRYIKRVLAHLMVSRLRYTAQPNRRAGSMVVPELIGYLTPEAVAVKVVEVLGTDTDDMSERLQQIMGKRGAAHALVSELEVFLDHDGVKARP